MGTTLLVAVNALVVGATRARPDKKYEPLGRLRSGEQVAVVFIGASYCGATRVPGFSDSLEAMKILLAHRVEEQNRLFTVIGVALDWDVSQGQAFLRKFGKFDEIMVGGNWLNAAAIKYIWNDFPGHPGIPQVVVLLRGVQVQERAVSVVKERLLGRWVGLDEIEEWIGKGAPIPAP